MLGWLKRLLRRWLLEGEEPKPLDLRLECRVLSGDRPCLRTYLIGGATGMLLHGVELEGGQEVRLLAEHEALDPAQWRRLWQHFTPDHEGWRWEDGTPFEAGG